MKTPVIAAARVTTWKKKFVKQLILASLFGQMSNQYAEAMTLPKANENPLPSAVVMKVTDDFNNGAYKCTIPAARVTSTTVVRGPNPAAGRENRAKLAQVGAYWQVKRIPYAVQDESVEGNILKFYKWADQTAGFITTDFVKDDDFDHQRATLQGADVSLVDASYWQNSEKGSSINAPLADTLHPNFYAWVGGKLKKNVWSETYDTAVSNLETVLDDMSISDTFNMKLVDAIQRKAGRTVAPLGGFQGNNAIKWVLKISDVQWGQLMEDSAGGSVQDRFKYTETGFEKLHSGDMGIYRGMLVVTDQRSPLAKIETSSVTFQYITADGDDRAPVATNAVSNTGTVELAVLYGNGALVQGVKSEVEFKQQWSQDYGFEEGLCGVVKRAVRRCDIDTDETATSGRVNESSFVVATATVSADA